MAQIGGATETITTGIRISAGQLCRVHGLLVVGTPTGTPLFTATPSVANGVLVVTVVNVAGGGAANAAPWMLDVQLEHSLVQATRGANGYILIASGTAAAGFGGSQTLSQTYLVGAAAENQTLALATIKGDGIIVDGSTQVGAAGLYAFEVREGTNYPIMAITRRGNDATGTVLEMNKSRGAFGAPADVQAGDYIGTMTFEGRVGGLPVEFAHLAVQCINAAGGGSAGLELYLLAGGAPTQALAVQVGASANTWSFYREATLIPVGGSSALGVAIAPWSVLHVTTANVYANVCLGGATPGAGANQTVLLPNAGTVAPATSVGAAHLYSGTWNGPGTEFGQTSFAWSQEAAVIAPVSSAVVSHLIPVVVNGVPYLLMASTVI